MALLQPDTARIGHTSGKPAEDRVSDERVFGTPRELREALSKLIGGDQVLHRAIDLVRYASDASPYRLIPQVVVTPRTTGDVVAILKYCRENGRHATFRAAGTSLCGQAQSDDILIDVRKHWYGMSLADGGSRFVPGPVLFSGTPAPSYANTAVAWGLTRRASMRARSAASSPTTQVGCGARLSATPTTRSAR